MDMNLHVVRWHRTQSLSRDTQGAYLVNTSNHWVVIIHRAGEWVLHDDGVCSRVPNLRTYLMHYDGIGARQGCAVYMVHPSVPPSFASSPAVAEVIATTATDAQRCGMRAMNVIRQHLSFPSIDVGFMNGVACQVASMEAALLGAVVQGDLQPSVARIYSAEVFLSILNNDMNVPVMRWQSGRPLPQGTSYAYLVNTSHHWVSVVMRHPAAGFCIMMVW